MDAGTNLVEKVAMMIHDSKTGGCDLAVRHEVDIKIQTHGIMLHHFPLFDCGGARMVLDIPIKHIHIEKDSESPKTVVRLRLKRDVSPTVMDSTGKFLKTGEDAKDIRTWCSIPFKTLDTGTELQIDCNPNWIDFFWRTLSSMAAYTTSLPQTISVTDGNLRNVLNHVQQYEEKQPSMWCDLRETQTSYKERKPGLTDSGLFEQRVHEIPYKRDQKVSKAKWKQQQLQHLHDTKAAPGLLKVNEWLRFASTENNIPAEGIAKETQTSYQQQQQQPCSSKHDYWRVDRAKTRWKVGGLMVVQKNVATSTTIMDLPPVQYEYGPVSMVTPKENEPITSPEQWKITRNHQADALGASYGNRKGQPDESKLHSAASNVPPILMAERSSSSSSTGVVLHHSPVKSESIQELPKKHWTGEKKAKRRGGALFDSI